MLETIYPRSTKIGVGSAINLGKFAASWPAVIAGAFVAIVTSLVLLALGSVFGLAPLSPQTDHSVSAATFAMATAIWLIATQWISAGLGGYIAGRLRNRWYGTRTSEIFLRDTVHGLVTWAVATVVVATLAGAPEREPVADGAEGASATAQNMVLSLSSPVASYMADTLVRSANSMDSARITTYRKVAADNILANTLATGSLPIVDSTYLAAETTPNAAVPAADGGRETTAPG